MKISDKWVVDTGIVLSLVFLVLGATSNERFLWLSGAALLVTALAPSLLRPIAIAWLWVARVLEAVMSRVFFGLVFFLVVTPMGLLRRLFGSAGHDFSQSALIVRERKFQASDLETPF